MATKNFNTRKLLPTFRAKPMSSPVMFLSLILIPLSASFSTPHASGDHNTATTTDNLSAYQVLQSYDFPIGLLPKGVTGYELNRDTGEFAAYLNGTCKFSIQSYSIRYKSKITGVISKDRIKNLGGISVKVLFFWINIIEVTRDGDELQFSVGIVSANFAISNFFESPQCGCGFNCDELDEGALMSY